MAKDKKKKGKGSRASILLAPLVGAVFGAFIGYFLPNLPHTPTRLLVIALSLLVAAVLHLLVHEAGHLVFGLLTGYQFASFRVDSFMWVKEGDTIKFKRMSLVGTAGQCLMAPPELVDGKMPFVLYNMGGVVFNVLAGGLSLVLFLAQKQVTYLSFALLLIGVFGLLCALLNGFPLHLAAINNDGCNTRSLHKNPQALYSFWMQLHVSAQIAQGLRLKDMPAEWFYIPADEEMHNSMVTVIAVFHCNRLMDLQAFDEVYPLIDHLLELDSAIVGLHRSLLHCDRIYCELVGENRPDRLATMLDGPYKKFAKAMKNFPSVIRTEYAHTLLAEKDLEKATQIMHRFEKVARSYPYLADIQSERELMQVADAKYAEIFSSAT